MEELCRSIGIQNATILTGRSVGSVSLLAPATISCQQPYTEKAKPQKDTRKTQADTDDGENPIISDDSEENKMGQEHKCVDKSFTDELSAYVPKESVLMQSVRDRKPQGLFVTERYPVGCKIRGLENDILTDLLADSNASTGGSLIIQDINNEWAEILRSKFPESVHTTFLAEHMIRLDGNSITEASLSQLGKDIGNICPDARLRAEKLSDECLAIDIGFPLRFPEHQGLHIDFVFETTRLERVPMEYSFKGSTRRTVYEKDASENWRRTSQRMSWCQLGEQFCKIECLSLNLLAHR